MTPDHPFPIPREEQTMLKRLYDLLDEFEDRPTGPFVGLIILIASCALILMLPGLAVRP